MGWFSKEKPAIYGILCQATNKWYIGASKAPSRRIKEHFGDMKGAKWELSHYGEEKLRTMERGEMKADFAIHGKRNFVTFILEEVESTRDLPAREREWQAHYNSVKHGYNKQGGGRHRAWKSKNQIPESYKDIIRR